MDGGELSFLQWLVRTAPEHPGALRVPPGDDGAVWRLDSGEELVLATDALAEGVHFTRDVPPALVGRKALAVNLSDLAAMGAKPLCGLATCALPKGFPDSLPREVTNGLREAGRRYGCPLAGGDTLSHEGGLLVSVSVIGAPVKGGPVTRAGGRPGDVLAVTGALGGAVASGRHLGFEPRLAEAERILASGAARAMIDVSDGLLLDLNRLADACGAGFLIEGDRIPVHPGTAGGLQGALREGEDFELLFAAPPEAWRKLEAGWDLETPVTAIGTLTPPSSGRVLILDGRRTPAAPEGYEHR